jgi:NAD(P)-dependent dehydrogenase (short-subunit alcohol dehydrogenase family)
MSANTAGKLKDQVTLITGAGRGIGRAIALRFAEEGASIAAVARSESELCSLVAEIQMAGGNGVAIPADLSDRAELTRVVARCLEAFGTIDILVNNAGVGSGVSPKPLVDFDDNFWDFTLAVNLTAPYLLTKAVLPILIAKKGGRIINIASIASRIGLLHGGAYAASKHGLLGLTRTAALEVALDGITVNAICPGPVHTWLSDLRLEYDAKRLGGRPEELASQSTPIGRRLEPEEITGTALLLASNESRAITGQAFDVCGGLFMA